LQEELDSGVLEMRATVGEFVQIAAFLVGAPDSEFPANLTAQLLAGNHGETFGFGLNGAIQDMEFDWENCELVNSTLPVFKALASSTYATYTNLSQTQSGFIQGESRYIGASQGMNFGELSAK
jgi:hypothetical protein